MEFQKATDRLLAAGVTLAEIAEALDVSYSTVRAVRLDPKSDSHRPPPTNWKPRLAILARTRGSTLHRLAEELEG